MRNHRSATHRVNTVVSLATVLCAPLAALAVRPLTTDDADTVEYTRLQLSLAGNYLHERGARVFALPFNVVYGVSYNCEFGVLAGPQWLRHSRDGEKRWGAGALDTGLSLKYRWLNNTNAGFIFSTRADVKLPTASENLGLGTGAYDGGLVLLLTKTWRDFSFDSNLGYTFNDPSDRLGNGEVFAGQSMRYALTEKLSAVGEIIARVPVETGGSTMAEIHGGFQWEIARDLVLDGLIGTGLTSSSPHLF